MKKKSIRLLKALFGVIAVLSLTACGIYKNSRTWIEDKVSEVGRVYPTKNLFDLFEEFPDGFEIHVGDIYKRTAEGTYSQEIDLEGVPENNEIKGTFKIIKSEGNPYRETVLLESEVTYTKDGLVFSNPEVSSEDLLHAGFLFQEWTLNKEVLAKFELNKKSYSWETGDAYIIYNLQDKVVNDYFEIDEDTRLTFEISTTASMLMGYQYGFVIRLTHGDMVHTEKFYSKTLDKEALKNGD